MKILNLRFSKGIPYHPEMPMLDPLILIILGQLPSFFTIFNKTLRIGNNHLQDSNLQTSRSELLVFQSSLELSSFMM